MGQTSSYDACHPLNGYLLLVKKNRIMNFYNYGPELEVADLILISSMPDFCHRFPYWIGRHCLLHKFQTMKKYIIPFDELTMRDIGQVGGKNASLGEMINSFSELGVAVPQGFA